jgi:uncharacterized protein YjiS (DUF1127 family)
MKEVVKKEILYDLDRTINIMQVREDRDIEELRILSDHAIEDVALYKDLDLISVTVLIYSLYKIAASLPDKDYQNLLKILTKAKESLKHGNLGGYNRYIKQVYEIVHKSNAKVKQHFSNVMHAARIKKGSALLQKGLSIGQAAGLMGLSNWDLQEYVGKTLILEKDHEAVPAKKRLLNAFKLWGLT